MQIRVFLAANTEQGDSNDPNPNLVEGKPELHQPELTSTPNMASAEVEQNLMPPVPVPNQPLTVSCKMTDLIIRIYCY